jgi:hypothetical protein
MSWIPRALALEGKPLGHEANHSSPFGAQFKNAWSYTSTPLYIFIKYYDNITFTTTGWTAGIRFPLWQEICV